jgi:hypothetical protein
LYLTFAFLVAVAIFSARSLRKKKVARKELEFIAENGNVCGFKSHPKAELPYLHIALTGAATLQVGLCFITSFDLEIYINVIFPVVFVWVKNLVGHIEEGTQTKIVWEQGVEENIWV